MRDDKVVFIYSDARYANILMHWLATEEGYDVVPVFVGLGNPFENHKEFISQLRSLKINEHYTFDAKADFANKFISKAILANGVYEGKYPLCAALSRPLISEYAVRVAEKVGARLVFHGNSGNDQIRMEGYLNTFSESINAKSALSLWGANQHEIEVYAKKNKLKLGPTGSSDYSISGNIWGSSIEGGVLENLDNGSEKVLPVGTSKVIDNSPKNVELEFKEGLPVALDGKNMTLLDIIRRLNKIAGNAGVGVTDMVEDGIVGLKTRSIYRWPAAYCIIEAHRELEALVHTRHENLFKPMIDAQWAYMVYAGLWYEPLFDSLNAFIKSSNRYVSGIIRLKLQNGHLAIIGRRSKFSLFDKDISIFNFGHTFGKEATSHFGDIHYLHSRMARKMHKSGSSA